MKYPFWRALYFCAPLSPFIPSTRGVGILTKDLLWSPNPLISSLLSTRVYPRCVFSFQTLRTMLISSVVGVGFCWAEGRVDSWFELLGNIGINPRRVIYARTLRSSGHCRKYKREKSDCYEEVKCSVLRKMMRKWRKFHSLLITLFFSKIPVAVKHNKLNQYIRQL